MKEENDSSSIYRMASFASPVYGVAEKLREAGYEVAGRLGVKQKQLDPNMISVLKDREPVQRSFFGFKVPFWYRKQRALHLGKVWFNDTDRNAAEDENWVFEAHGEKEMKNITSLLEEIKPYHVRVQATLEHNVPKRETYLHELC